MFWFGFIFSIMLGKFDTLNRVVWLLFGIAKWFFLYHNHPAIIGLVEWIFFLVKK